VREAQADRAPFHGIFVDFNMPGMDGYGFCRRVREDAAIEPKPALAIVTSDTVRLKRKDFQDIGVVTYMMKPVKKQALLDGALEMLAASGTSVKQAVVKQGGYEKGDLPELSILVADDAEDNRVLMSAMLKGSRIKLELAVDGRDALEKLGKNKYDLVFMDMLMPEMDGYVATEKFRELEAREGRKRTKVVALTAMATRDDAEKTIKAGCDDYLSKPIRRNTFYSYLVNFAAGRA
jgi:CheY-like chemotaxis protein